MPPKPMITSVPAGFQGMWRLDPTLNRGESTPIQAITMAGGFYSGGEDSDDDGGDDDGDDENQSENGTPNQAPPLQSNTQGRPRKKRKSKGEEEDILQGNGRSRVMSPGDYIILLKICLRMADTYRSPEAATFFKNVAADWMKETGKEHRTLHQVLRRGIAARRKYLEDLGIGEQDGRTERESYEDNWIAVLDADATVIRERREHQGNIGAKSEASFLAHAAMLLTMKGKRSINPPVPSPSSTPGTAIGKW
ncbi:hypothetical protein GMDG_05922 [Pseudogymnoascus destructans 20631-21]|uniref:Uncharacterized protein n=1 Tax=Pseudogymnoascus destructans (strain ATCC MYA-4855 / 20631-21) TaxID=658429 RepID=L8FRJ8_PSED2|nr:hypothetical protein GMDG_05922 [Pseudogymnoascus destructans 20631-21]